MEKDWGDKGGQILKCFDIVLDCSQYTNLDILGTRYLKYQDNYTLDMLAANLEGTNTFDTALQHIRNANDISTLKSLHTF